MDQGDLKNLRELVEFLKTNGIAEFDLEQSDMKVRLKFEGGVAPGVASGMSAVDLAALAQMLRPATTVVAAPMPAAAMAPMELPQAAAPAAAEATPAGAEVDEDAGLHIVKSPLVGTFYDAPSPGADAFAKIGDSVASGKVLCIVEAMKIMNEIESDVSGVIAKVYAKPGQPVEYGQRLFGIRA